MHMVTKYETTFEEAMQQTVTMNAKIELTHHVAEYNAMHMDTKYETNLEEEKTDDTKNVDTYMNNAEMIADSTHQQDLNEDYPKMAAVQERDDKPDGDPGYRQDARLHGRGIRGTEGRTRDYHPNYSAELQHPEPDGGRGRAH
jgi:hypothetical protein